MHTRIETARENRGHTQEDFAELLYVSVSHVAEVERGRAGISLKMLVKICNVLGLSADYVLFGGERDVDARLLDKLRRIDEKYLPMLDRMITELLALSG